MDKEPLRRLSIRKSTVFFPLFYKVRLYLPHVLINTRIVLFVRTSVGLNQTDEFNTSTTQKRTVDVND